MGKSIARYRKYDSMDITTSVVHDDNVGHINKTTDVPFPVIVICNNSPHSRRKCKSNARTTVISCITYVLVEHYYNKLDFAISHNLKAVR